MLTNSGRRPSDFAITSVISTSKPTSASGCEGSASTNGAPPSGSPAQRNGACAETTCAQATTHENTKTARELEVQRFFFVRFVFSCVSWAKSLDSNGGDDVERSVSGDRADGQRVRRGDAPERRLG